MFRFGNLAFSPSLPFSPTLPPAALRLMPSQPPGMHDDGSVVVGSTGAENEANTIPKLIIPALPPSTLQLSTPLMYRRHSHNPSARKPLRSSPLAGPALSSDGSVLGPDNSERGPKPSRISSTPDLALLTPPPPARFTRPKSAHGASHVSFQLDAVPRESRESLFFTRNPARQSLFSNFEKRTSTLENTVLACPPILELPSSSSSVSLSSDPTGSRPQSFHGYLHPNHTTAPAINNGPAALPPVASRHPSDNTWLTENPYASTPKFSRLGLSSSNVVLPLTPKEHKRVSRSRSSTSIASSASSANCGLGIRSISTTTLPSIDQNSMSPPKLGRVESTSSASSSCDSLFSPPMPRSSFGSRTPSLSSSLDIATITEVDEHGQNHTDTQEHTPNPVEKSESPRKEPLLARMKSLKSLRLRVSPSHSDIHHAEVEFQALSLGTVPNKDKQKDQPPRIVVELIPAVTEDGVVHSGVVPRVPPTKPRKRDTVRRFWRTLLRLEA